jgi:hypothetical protein
MTVQELINKLQHENPSARVVFMAEGPEEDDIYEVSSVTAEREQDAVVIGGAT